MAKMLTRKKTKYLQSKSVVAKRGGQKSTSRIDAFEDIIVWERVGVGGSACKWQSGRNEKREKNVPWLSLWTTMCADEEKKRMIHTSWTKREKKEGKKYIQGGQTRLDIWTFYGTVQQHDNIEGIAIRRERTKGVVKEKNKNGKSGHERWKTSLFVVGAMRDSNMVFNNKTNSDHNGARSLFSRNPRCLFAGGSLTEAPP